MVYKIFDKESRGTGIKSMLNQQLANELHNLIIAILKKASAYSSFRNNFWGVDLADMQLKKQIQQRN